MSDRDRTDPGLGGSPLDFVAVSEKDCRDRTSVISGQIVQVQKTLNEYLSKQKGKKEGIALVFQVLKYLLLVLALIGAVWGAAHYLEERAKIIVAANHQTLQPTSIPVTDDPTK